MLKGFFFFFSPKKAMSHPIVRTDSLQPGCIRSPGTPSVTVVTGHTGYDMLEKEVGWKLVCFYLHVCSNNWKTLGQAEEYVGCLKAVGSVYNCSAVISVFSQRGDVLSLLTDRP